MRVYGKNRARMLGEEAREQRGPGGLREPSEFDPREFRARLQAAMEDAGATPRELAEHIGMNRKQVYAWMNGDVLPNARSAVPVATALGVTVGWLLGAEGGR